jgi:hypothetical protein
MCLSFRSKGWVLFKQVLAILLLITSVWVAPAQADVFTDKYSLLTDYYPDHIKGLSTGEMNRWAASAIGQTSKPYQRNPYSYGRSPNDSAPPDWRGIRRDTFYFEGLQLIIIGALYVGPESISGWSNIDKIISVIQNGRIMFLSLFGIRINGGSTMCCTLIGAQPIILGVENEALEKWNRFYTPPFFLLFTSLATKLFLNLSPYMI